MFKRTKIVTFLFTIILLSNCVIRCEAETITSEPNTTTVDLKPGDTEVLEKTWSESFFSGFALIFISELLDRTFFLNMIYALSHSFLKTFILSSCTLVSLNFLALMLGNSIPIFFYKTIIDWIAVFVFFLFGGMLLYDSYKEDGMLMIEEYKDVETDLQKKHKNIQNIVLQEPLIEKNSVNEKGIAKKDELFDSSWSFVTSLILAEIGDKSQFTGVIIGAVYNFNGVLLGTSLGFMLCILISILAGHFLSESISKRQISFISGCTFMLFGITYLIRLTRIFG